MFSEEVERATASSNILQSYLDTLQVTLGGLETNHENTTRMRRQLITLNGNIDILLESSRNAQKMVIELKQNCIQMVRSVRTLESAARQTARYSYSKVDFVLGILQVCDIAVFHKQAWGQVDKLVEWVVTDYGGRKLPDAVGTVAGQVRNKMRLELMPSQVQEAGLGGAQVQNSKFWT